MNAPSPTTTDVHLLTEARTNLADHVNRDADPVTLEPATLLALLDVVIALAHQNTPTFYVRPT